MWRPSVILVLILGACGSSPAAGGGDTDAAGLKACSDPAYYGESLFPPPAARYPDPGEPAILPGDVVNMLTRFATGTESHGVYWSHDDDELEFDFLFAFGTGVPAPVAPYNLMFFLDHRPLVVEHGATRVTRVPLDWSVSTRRAAVNVRIAAESVSPGGHTLYVLIERNSAREDGSLSVRTIPFVQYTIFRDSYLWDEPSVTDGGSVLTAAENLLENARVRSSDRFLASSDLAPDDRGRLEVRLAIQSTSEALASCAPPHNTDRAALVALLDGVPHPIGPSDGAILADVSTGTRVSFNVDIADLPRDGEGHRLEILQLSGMRKSRSVDLTRPGLSQAGAQSSRRIGFAYWR